MMWVFEKKRVYFLVDMLNENNVLRKIMFSKQDITTYVSEKM